MAGSHTLCPHHLQTPIQAESRQTDRKILVDGNGPCLFLITSRIIDGVIRGSTTHFSKSTQVKNEVFQAKWVKPFIHLFIYYTLSCT